MTKETRVALEIGLEYQRPGVIGILDADGCACLL
jgi:hypothetical protein